MRRVFFAKSCFPLRAAYHFHELPVYIENDAEVGEVGALAAGRGVVRVGQVAARRGPLVARHVPVSARGP